VTVLGFNGGYHMELDFGVLKTDGVRCCRKVPTDAVLGRLQTPFFHHQQQLYLESGPFPLIFEFLVALEVDARLWQVAGRARSFTTTFRLGMPDLINLHRPIVFFEPLTFWPL